jgi:hypothetical protein
MTNHAQTARRANAQIRRLRAALEQARGIMATHFGEEDAAVRACDRALNPPQTLAIDSATWSKFAHAVTGRPLLPWQVDIVERLGK